MNTFAQRLAEALKTLLSSKKTITAIAGALVYLAAKRGIVLSPDDAQAILALVALLIGGQAAADIGKSKAQIEAANPKPPEAFAIGSAQTVNAQSQVSVTPESQQ